MRWITGFPEYGMKVSKMAGALISSIIFECVCGGFAELS